MTKYLAILSGKGGVGKTTSALNLGIALSKYKRDVVVVDADINMPNIALSLGSTNLPIYLNHALKGKNSIIEAVYSHPSGMKIIPASIRYDDIQGVDVNSLGKHLGYLDNKTELVIVDCPSGIGQEVKSVLEKCDDAIIVTNPDLVSVTDALRTIHFTEAQGVTVLGVVVNKMKQGLDEMSIDNVETMLGKPILSEIPHDTKILDSINRKHPIVYTNPDNTSSRNYKQLAAKLIGDVYFEPEISQEIVEKSFWQKFLDWIK